MSNSSSAAQIEQADVAGDGQVSELRAGALGQQLPRHDVAVVLHLGEQDHVAGLDVLRAPGLRDEVDALGGAAREDDFVGAAGVDEFRGARAGGFEGGGGAVAQLVDAAMDVGVVVLVVMDAARRSPRAASAWWRRCRNRSAAGRGPSGRGSGKSARSADQSMLFIVLHS